MTVADTTTVVIADNTTTVVGTGTIGAGSGGGAVDSVNGHTGIVVLTASDVGAATPADVTAEASARAAAITTEASTRATADTNEASARAAADSSEATARANADATNATAITTETSRAEAAEATLIPLSQKAAASGVASLDSGGRIPAGQLPSLVLSHTYVVGSQAAMLALSAANVGDLAIRTDVNETFILTSPDPTQLVNWTQLLFPGGGAVTSVNTRTGAVTGLAENSVTVTGGTGLSGGGDLSANRTISMPNVGTAGTLGDATHVVQITTDAQGRVSGATAVAITGLAQSDITGLVAALAAKAPIASPTFTGTVAGITKSMVGLGNVDNTADSAKTFAGSQITSGTIDMARLYSSGVPSGNKFLREATSDGYEWRMRTDRRLHPRRSQCRQRRHHSAIGSGPRHLGRRRDRHGERVEHRHDQHIRVRCV